MSTTKILKKLYDTVQVTHAAKFWSATATGVY